ncbi:unnamed protein product [Clonostachys byssicola]|uniref:NACHT domain-containing protein n=1 Tax=Clonostachys byssicola TaxID=160290 RepID=A0A9N9UEZ2_9HYPO|nr:unnamed protein product [Clonostachys byssicola]
MAMLPSNFPGKVSAASVASHMVRTFQNIRVVLMVGIGGGAPSKANDIRLGDVVVGAEGVLPYDMGKNIQGMDEFHITGKINIPPMFLGTVVSNLGRRMRRQPRGHDLQGKIEKALENVSPFVRKSCHRPDPASDQLYHAHIVHPDATIDCAKACGSDPGNLVEQKPREDDTENVEIHYGLIASADQVMKNATMRDKFSRDHKVLCFEMEAAGLTHQFPCLVIRGICHYSDTHNHDKWQGYAAMAAAAYAKDLLSIMPPETVQTQLSMQKQFYALTQDVAQLQMKSEAQEERSMLDWLANDNYIHQHREALSKRYETTGDWFLELPSIEKWKENKGLTLFCTGDLGSGKTVLTSIIIQHLLTKYQDNGKIGIAYVYFNLKRKEEQTIDKLLEIILRQLIHKQGSARHGLMALYSHSGLSNNPSRPQTRELIALLNQVLTKFEKTYLVIDAIDECPSPTPRVSFLSQLAELRVAHGHGLNILITARTETRIGQVLPVDLTQLITSQPKDLEHFLEHELRSNFPEFMEEDGQLFSNTISSIVKQAGGTFLTARLFMDLLIDEHLETKAELRLFVQDLVRPRGSSSSMAKMELIGRLDEKSAERIRHRELAMKTLLWNSYTKTQPTADALKTALVLLQGTTMEEEEITHICITCLSYPDFAFEDREDREGIVEFRPFYKYAASYWDITNGYLSDARRITRSVHAARSYTKPLATFLEPGMGKLHQIAYFGLENLYHLYVAE